MVLHHIMGVNRYRYQYLEATCAHIRAGGERTVRRQNRLILDTTTCHTSDETLNLSRERFDNRIMSRKVEVKAHNPQTPQHLPVNIQKILAIEQNI